MTRIQKNLFYLTFLTVMASCKPEAAAYPFLTLGVCLPTSDIQVFRSVLEQTARAHGYEFSDLSDEKRKEFRILREMGGALVRDDQSLVSYQLTRNSGAETIAMNNYFTHGAEVILAVFARPVTPEASTTAEALRKQLSQHWRVAVLDNHQQSNAMPGCGS
jgi:hypothetical protein